MKRKYSKQVFFLSILFLFIIFGYLYFIKENTSSEYTTKEVLSDQVVINSNMEEENKVQGLKQEYQNQDIKAILSIDNSNFSYPVAQTTDNDYYLTHNYNKEYNALGSIYADYRVNLEGGHKILIFGHSSSKTTTPFNTLENYYEEDYYQDHKYITLQTETNTYRYEIFSVYVETSDFTYMNLSFESKASWYRHLLSLKSKSIYQTNIELTEDDEILIMQTCSKHPNYKKNSKKYLLIVSRRVK